jgi:hypothetical protein
MKDAVMQREFSFVFFFEFQNRFDIGASLRRRSPALRAASGHLSLPLARRLAVLFRWFLSPFPRQIFGLCPRLAFGSKISEFVVRKMFDSHKGVAYGPHSDEFVELDLNGCTISVLRIPNQENHQESDDCRSRVDHQLPGIGKAEQWAGYRPHKNNARSKHEGRCPPGGLRRLVRDVAENPTEIAWVFVGSFAAWPSCRRSSMPSSVRGWVYQH